MKSYEEYLRSHDGWHGMVAQLHRDILAELELSNMKIEKMNARLAKLEDRLQLWENVPQTSVVEGEAASTDNINPFTPPGPTGKEIHQAFVQWMTRRAKLEEARKP